MTIIRVFNKKLFCLLLICAAATFPVAAQSFDGHSLNIKNNKDLHSFFAYKNDGAVIISGHRGGREKGFPENSIEGFGNVLSQLPAFFEIDPRLTKDSVIVLMHDATLDRTTTGKGKVSDYTWKELQSVRLKDSEGNVTQCSIPTLEKVITWSKGRTVVNLDKKDVPMEMIVALIKKLKAQDHVMLTVHTGAQARYYYDRFPDIMLSVFARTAAEYEDMTISGVPWKNMIAYVGPTYDEKNRKIIESLHGHGVRCMISVSPTHDTLPSSEKRKIKYKEEIRLKPDIIETDIPTEVWKVLQWK